jgi:hypothetical protein
MEILSLRAFFMFIGRVNQDLIYTSFASPFVTAILGPRRVGKSTLVQRFVEQHPEYKWVQLNMDRQVLRERVQRQELVALIEESAQQKIHMAPMLWVAIDEAQKCPALFEQIKMLYDEYKDRGQIKFILTGSGALSLHQLSAETLAGRIELFYLQELSLYESACVYSQKTLPFCSVLDLVTQQQWSALQNVVDDLSPFKPVLEHCLQIQMLWGGLPELWYLQAERDELLERQRLQYLYNYLQTYLEKDVRGSEIMDLVLYRDLMQIIAEQTGSIRNDSKIRAALRHCHVETLKKYRGFLTATLLYEEVFPYIGVTLKRLTKSPKAYLTSNGLISALTEVYDFAALRLGLIGHRFENWFLNLETAVRN